MLDAGTICLLDDAFYIVSNSDVYARENHRI